MKAEKGEREAPVLAVLEGTLPVLVSLRAWAIQDTLHDEKWDLVRKLQAQHSEMKSPVLREAAELLKAALVFWQEHGG